MRIDIGPMNTTELIERNQRDLIRPSEKTSLYKILPSRYFLHMVKNSYLYFNRVDSYKDDRFDSDQTIKDRQINKNAQFEGHTSRNLGEDYYSPERKRMYACCFSTQQVDCMWEMYSYNDPNAVCLVFNCAKLRDFINTYYRYSCIILAKQRDENLFLLNYGLVKYGDFQTATLNEPYCPNPLEYTYFKDTKYSHEKEYRISLWWYEPTQSYNLPTNVALVFDFKKAIKEGIIEKILIRPYTKSYLITKMKKITKHKGIYHYYNKSDGELDGKAHMTEGEQ